MTFSIQKHKNDLLFLPLGGAGEIGMNLNLYYMDGKWLIVDFGAGFAEDYLPGVDMIVPDISFLLEHKNDICGLVLTHAHEDHLGAIVHLWHEFQCPVYATPFTAAFLKAKLADNKLSGRVQLAEVAPGSSFKVGPFDLEMVAITHSAPEMNGVFLRTKHGNVFHSGDWKLDPRPMVGEVTDEAKLRKYGDEGVLAMIGDSTNVFSPGKSGSEGDLRDSLIKIVAECKRMVIVTTFASNVARVESIAKAAQAAGRHVVLAGRSLWRIVDAAQQAGYLKDCPPFLTDDQVSSYPREQMLIIATGCQGEPLAAINKIANGSHQKIMARPGDTVIFSSKIIPGNDKRIFRLFNHFVKAGIETITEKEHFVHVSGHPNQDDMKMMYEMVRPQVAIPVHGEDVHMQEHVHLAKSWGVPHAIKVENGQVVKLAPGTPEKVAMVQAGILAVDGNFLLPPDSSILRMRRKMQRDGLIMVTLLLSKESMRKTPIIKAPGVLDAKEDADVFTAMIEEMEDALDSHFRHPKAKSTDEHLSNLVRSAVRRVLKSEVGKNPPIEVHIERL